MNTTRAIEITPRQREVLLDVFSRYAGKIVTVGVYGSRAQGRARPGSDVDLVVYGGLTPGDIANIVHHLDESDLSIFADVIAYATIDHAPLRQQVDYWMLPLFNYEDLIAAATAQAA